MTDTTTSTDHAAGESQRTRIAAIEDSGWGRSFTFFQPRNLAFWVYLLFVLLGIPAFVPTLTSGFDAFGTAIVGSALVFVAVGALFWWFLRTVDRYARRPLSLVVVACMWGGIAAPWAIAAPANTAMSSWYAKVFGQAWTIDWGAGLSAPFMEEIAKGLGLVLVIALAPRLVRTAFDGFVLGGFIGLGFEVLENVAYAAHATGSVVSITVVRSLTGLCGHVVFSAMFCAGLIYLLGRPAEPRRVGRGLALMVGACLVHGLWDSMSALAGGNTGLVLLLMVALVVGALVSVAGVFRMTVTRPREVLRAVMAPELEHGVVTGDEYDAICGDRKARRAFRKAGANRRERRRRDNVLDAGFDLAHTLASVRGAEDDRVAFTRNEIARIRAGIPSPAL